MKSLSTLVVFLLAVSPSAADSFLQVRPLDPWSRESFDRGMSRSAHFRKLVDLIERSDVIVHIESSDALPQGTAGRLRFAATCGGYRYVRVTLARWLSPDHRASILGHELQHAREVAESKVSDPEDLRALYTTIGHKVSGMKNTFETAAAADAGEQVWFELHGLRSARAANTRAHRQ